MEAEDSGSDLVILIYRASPIRPDQLLLPIHQSRDQQGGAGST